MGVGSRIRSLWRAVTRRSEFESDMAEEFRFHQERRAEDLVRAGLTPAAAARQARLEFGSVETHRARARESVGLRWFDEAGQDVRFLGRSVRRRPGGFGAALVTVAVGIGAATALLTMVDHILVRPLPYGAGQDLHVVWGVTASFDQVQPSWPDFVDWRRSTRSVELGFAYGDVLSRRGPEGVEPVVGAAVSGGFFDVMSTAPLLGRVFAPEEEERGEPRVVLSYGLWQRQFGGDRGVVGRSVLLESSVVPATAFTVVGVMPAGFEWPEWAELWLPVSVVLPRAGELRQRDMRVDTRAIARVRRGSTPASAEAELRSGAAVLAAEYPGTNEGLSVRLSPLREEVIGDVGKTAAVMLVAGCLVLLLTCANVASVLVGRSIERGRELAVRSALGAGRGRLVRQLMTEHTALAAAGGVLGSALAVVAVRLMERSALAAGVVQGLPLPRLTELTVDGRVLGLALAVTLAAALAFGLLPALMAARTAPVSRLRQHGGEGGRVGAVRAHSALAAAQLAIAVGLVAGAGLLGRTLAELRATDPGFDPGGLLVLRVFPPDRYASPESRLDLYDRLAARAAAVPGVSGAALINHMPLAGGQVPTVVTPLGGPAQGGVPAPGGLPADSGVGALYRTASPDFFRVARLPVVRGRPFHAAEAAADVVVLSAGLAATLFPGEEAVGRHVRLTNPSPRSERRGEAFIAEVVGVAADARHNLRDVALPAVYVPHARDPWGNIQLVVRAAAGEAALIGPLRSAVGHVDPTLPTASLQPLARLTLRSMQRERALARLLAAFGFVALVLSTIGVYGALSNLVVRRLPELGVRAALGARPADLRRLVLRRAAWMVAAGAAIGSLAALAVGDLLEDLLFGVRAQDPVTVLGAALFLGAIGLAASVVPVVRAGRADPAALLSPD